MLVIRAFNTQDFERKRFDRANRDLTETSLFCEPGDDADDAHHDADHESDGGGYRLGRCETGFSLPHEYR